ncbi:MAG: TIR domain-containing protein, partial [Candidatus Acidiferrales bacterium]
PSAEPEEISGDFDRGICAELEESDSREDLNHSPSESPDLSMHPRTGGSASSRELRYEVALSFAGEDRSYVERTARALKRRGIRTFYDKYEVAALWGKDLYEHLDSIYRKRSKYTVMFISKHYATKLWTNHERKSAQARAFEESKEYILPARFDDTEVPGLLATVGYIDLNTVTPAEFADLIAEKLRTS